MNRYSVTCHLPAESPIVREDSDQDHSFEDASAEDLLHWASVRKDRISRAAKIMRQVHVQPARVEALVQESERRANIPWKLEEQAFHRCIAEAWILLAPLGVTPEDLREIVMTTLRDAWK